MDKGWQMDTITNVLRKSGIFWLSLLYFVLLGNYINYFLMAKTLFTLFYSAPNGMLWSTVTLIHFLFVVSVPLWGIYSWLKSDAAERGCRIGGLLKVFTFVTPFVTVPVYLFKTRSFSEQLRAYAVFFLLFFSMCALSVLLNRSVFASIYPSVMPQIEKSSLSWMISEEGFWCLGATSFLSEDETVTKKSSFYESGSPAWTAEKRGEYWCVVDGRLRNGQAIPVTERGCVQAQGKWEWNSGRKIMFCNLLLQDAGKACERHAECLTWCVKDNKEGESKGTCYGDTTSPPELERGYCGEDGTVWPKFPSEEIFPLMSIEIYDPDKVRRPCP